MSSPSDGEARELCEQALRMAYHDCESLMNCFVGLAYEAHACNDDEVAQIAREGLNACQPIREVLGRLRVHLSLS